MCDKCNKIKYYASKGGGVYGINYDGIGSNAMMLGGAFLGYVGAQKIDTTVSYFKDNVKTSGLVWTGVSLGASLMFPQLAASKLMQGVTIGAGVYGMKRLNEGFNILKGVNGNIRSLPSDYQERMARAQALAARQNQGLPENRDLERAATPTGMIPQGATPMLRMRLAA